MLNQNLVLNLIQFHQSFTSEDLSDFTLAFMPGQVDPKIAVVQAMEPFLDDDPDQDYSYYIGDDGLKTNRMLFEWSAVDFKSPTKTKKPKLADPVYAFQPWELFSLFALVQAQDEDGLDTFFAEHLVPQLKPKDYVYVKDAAIKDLRFTSREELAKASTGLKVVEVTPKGYATLQLGNRQVQLPVTSLVKC